MPEGSVWVLACLACPFREQWVQRTGQSPPDRCPACGAQIRSDGPLPRDERVRVFGPSGDGAPGGHTQHSERGAYQ